MATEIIKNCFTYRRFNSGGPGGQRQNTTENAVDVARFGCRGRSQDTCCQATVSLKSQHASKRAAQKLIGARIRAEIKKRNARGRSTDGERVRTYHEPDDRVTDGTGLRWLFAATVGKGKLGACIDGRRAAMAGAA